MLMNLTEFASTPAESVEASEQPDEQYMARIDDGERCAYEIVNGEIVERPVNSGERLLGRLW